MKRLFYISGTLFFLLLTLLVGIQVGERAATAGPGQRITGFTAVDAGSGNATLWVILDNGDVHKFNSALLATPGGGYHAESLGNFWQ